MTAPVDVDSPQLWQCGDGELVELLRERARAARKAKAAELEVVAALRQRNSAANLHFGKPDALLQDVLQLSPTEASRRLKRARVLCPSEGLTGEPIPAQLQIGRASCRERVSYHV